MQATSSAGAPTRSDGVEAAHIGRTGDATEREASASQPVQFERLVRVEFTAHEEIINGLERVRSIASHRLEANARLETLIAFMTEYFLDREDPARRHARREARSVQHEKPETTTDAPSVTTAANTRHAPETRTGASIRGRTIPARVRDQVFVRDRQCTFVGPDGQRCGSMHVLQVDHINPLARGGASTIDNLRLLCAYHNRLESERLMGKRGPSRVRQE
jgi:5-methylcytosine-specific restriction endonuclease McrA